jgi:hypothetical protein
MDKFGNDLMTSISLLRQFIIALAIIRVIINFAFPTYKSINPINNTLQKRSDLPKESEPLPKLPAPPGGGKAPEGGTPEEAAPGGTPSAEGKKRCWKSILIINC